ncbi:MAG: hypothetical protein ACOCZ5_00095 [bacterium]
MKYLKYLNEKEEQLNEIAPPDDIVQIFYSDLDLSSRTKILEAIDVSDDMIDVFGDDIIKNKIEETFKKKPLIMLRGSEIIKKMNFDF